MKFYVISIILTVIVLFIPIAQKAAADSGDNIIAVSLESVETIAEDEGSGSTESAGGGGGSGGSPRTEEKQVVQQQEKIKDNKQIKETVKEVSTNNQKSSVSESVSDKSSKTSDSVSASGNTGSEKGSGSGTSTGTGTGSGSGTGGGTGTGKGTGTGSGTGASTGTGTGSNSGKTYGCVKGKGYKMVSNPKIKLTRAQTLTIPSGTRVSVSASFTANGNLNISGVSGGNAEAQKLARNAASGIRVNVIDKTITKCSVTITYTLAE
ncbi:hypothetical protein [Sebaldella sp. S0638]|uniref:hypothetical protein n=1 Tax=Sebaldella sp. S0638 TaxID=2957809 RepID=UPI00209DF93F|nr:hypothetical protein [Sebaldella sp. S0638]MCP1223730.1 hypothetical protein [Sebaldella sp. S0638]